MSVIIKLDYVNFHQYYIQSDNVSVVVRLKSQYYTDQDTANICRRIDTLTTHLSLSLHLPHR